MTFFNTNHLSGSPLMEAVKNAKTQNELILKLFVSRKKMTASEVWEFFNKTFPITSARRAINTLTNQGYLVQTTDSKKSPYGGKEYYWQLSETKQVD
jgi:predicted transcriptional regulator